MRTFILCLKSLISIAAIVAVSAPHAESTLNNSVCKIQASGETVMILVCPNGLGQEAWKTAGQKACESSASEICNAWIWDDSSKAPKESPATDADMSKDQVRHAVAVWVNDAQRLILLRNVSKQQ